MRKAIIVPMQLDGISYLPELAPLFNEALKAVYGFDLLNPPEKAYGTASILAEDTYNLWSKRKREDWVQIRLRYRVMGVLVRVGSRLNLPLAAKNKFYEYYDIPQSAKEEILK